MAEPQEPGTAPRAVRFINSIWPIQLGEQRSNEELRPAYQEAVQALNLPSDERDALRKFIDFQLVGERSRTGAFAGWRGRAPFSERAAGYESAVDAAISTLAEKVDSEMPDGAVFDAVLTTTSTGNLMPQLSYRMARALPGRIPGSALLVDLGNAGCTGSIKQLRLASRLDESIRTVLLLSVEAPSTLIDLNATTYDTWQGNCTFGDGAAAVWIDTEPAGPAPLVIRDIRSWQRAAEGFDLIRWRYRDYYGFHLSDEKQFETDVRRHVSEALEEVRGEWDEATQWAVHPAGIALLVRLSRALGLSREALKPSTQSYRACSNMSSASILHILSDVQAGASPGDWINLVSMGAGFEILFGRLQRHDPQED